MQTEIEVIFTIIGTALCLGGWAVFWVGSRLLGLAVGLGFGFFFAQLLAQMLKLTEGATELVMLACSLLGAFGGLLLIRAVTTFLFSVIGFLFGALIGRVGCEIYFHANNATFDFTTGSILAIIVTAVVMAALAIWLQKHIMIVITSYVGASFLLAGIPWLERFEPYGFFALFIGAIVWQVVLVTQLLDDRKQEDA